MRHPTPRRSLSLLLLGCLPLLTLASCDGGRPASPAASQPAAATAPTLTPAQARRARAREAMARFYDETLVKPYETAGRRSDKWDDDAREALSGLVEAVSNELPGQAYMLAQAAATHADAALAAGCDDGVVTYAAAMLREFPGGPRFADQTQVADLYRKAVERLQGAKYPPVRLLYATYRSARADSRSLPAEVTTAAVDRAIDMLPAVANDPVIPNKVLADLCSDLVDLRSAVTGDRLPGFRQVDAALAKANPDGYLLHYNRGNFYVHYAWDARGNDFAPNVPADAWPVFAKRLDQAAAELTRAWEIDPDNPAAPRLMLTVELGQGKGRDRMELWYQRTLAANPDDYEAAHTKLTYLEPKWYGSPDAMLEFARQTYKQTIPDANPDYPNSRMPMILFEAHQSLAYYAGRDATGQWQADPNYWARPGVWDDLHPIFQRVLTNSPPGFNVGWRTLYALVAYHSKHYQEAHEQLEFLDGQFDPKYIRSDAEYRKLRASAEHLAKSPDAADPGADADAPKNPPSGKL